MSVDVQKEHAGNGNAPTSQLGRNLAFAAVALTNLVAALDASTLSVALPTISADIGGSAIDAFWAGVSYPLAQVATMLIWTASSQCFGRRPVLLVALLFFSLGAILAAVAQSYPLLLAGRTIQGLGGGGFVGLTAAIITDLFPLEKRPQYYALLSAAWAIGPTAGPIIGGALAEANEWRWIFWLNLPIVGVCAAGILAFLRLNYRQRTLAEKLRELDIIGILLFTTSITSFLIPITWGGTQFSWDSWHTLVPLCLGAAGILSFIAWEILTKGPKLLPVHIFLDYSTVVLYVAALFHGILLWALVYYMPELFQSVKGYSPLISGVAVLPQTVTVVPCSIAVGIAIGKTKRYRWSIWLGWILCTFGFGLLIYFYVEIRVAQWIFLTAVVGLGLGILFPSLALAAQASSPAQDAAMVSTLVIWFRSLGQTIGVALGGAVFSNQLGKNLFQVPGFARSGSIATTDAIALVSYAQSLDPADPITRPLREAFLLSFRTIWIIMCAFAGVMMLVCFTIKEYPMQQAHITDQGYIEKKGLGATAGGKADS